MRLVAGFTLVDHRISGWQGEPPLERVVVFVLAAGAGIQHRIHSRGNLVNNFYLNHIPDAGANLLIPGFDADVLYNNPGIPDFLVLPRSLHLRPKAPRRRTANSVARSSHVSQNHGRKQQVLGPLSSPCSSYAKTLSV